MTRREARMHAAVEANARRTPAERELRRAHFRERWTNPYADLTHRGAWRLPDVGAMPPELPPATATKEVFGDWGYQIVTEGVSSVELGSEA